MSIKFLWSFVFACILFNCGNAQANLNNYGCNVLNGSYSSIYNNSPSYFIWPASTSMSDDDYLSEATNIGFNFTYNGQVYTQFKASINGFITFNTAAEATYENTTTNEIGQYSNDPWQFYQNNGSLNVLAPFYTDLKMTTYIENNNSDVNSVLFYKLSGTAPNRTLDIEWKDLVYGENGVANFRIRLYEGSNNIYFIVGNYTMEAVEFENGSLYPIMGINGPSIVTSLQPASSEVLNLVHEEPYEFSHAITQTRTSNDLTDKIFVYSINGGSNCSSAVSLSNLQFTDVNHTDITGKFNKNNNNNYTYYVVRTSTNQEPSYNYNTSEGEYQFSGTTVYRGQDTVFNDAGLSPNTTYYYWVTYTNSYNCEANRPFFKTPVLSGSATTLNCTGSSGIFNIGPGGSFTTLTAYINAVQNTGLGGPVTLELLPTYNPASETYPINFSNLIPCSDNPNNQILIRPKSTVTSNITFSAANASTILKLDNIAYVTFDGRPGGSGTNKYFTFQNTDTLGSALQLLQNSHDNVFKYCNFISVNRLLTEGTIEFNNLCNTCYESGPHDNTIDFCEVYSGATTAVNAIYSKGAQDTMSTTPVFSNINNNIKNCNIRDYFSASKNSNGVHLDKGNSNWTLFKNSFYQTIARSYTSTIAGTHRDIYINSGFGYTIKANNIGGTASLTGGSKMELSGLMNYHAVDILQYVREIINSSNRVIQVHEYGNTRIDSNFIQNIKVNTTREIRMMYLQKGNFDIGNEDANYFGGLSSSDSIVFNGHSGYNSYVIHIQDIKLLNCINNNFHRIRSNNSSYMHIIYHYYSTPYNSFSSASILIQHNNFNQILANVTRLYGIRINTIVQGSIIDNILQLENVKNSGGLYGISVLNGNFIIYNNQLFNFRGGQNITGIEGGGQVLNNSIYDFSSSTGGYITGIDDNLTGISRIANNNIHTFVHSHISNSASICGIKGYRANIENNSIRLGFDANGNPSTFLTQYKGLEFGSNPVRYNSIYIGGSENSTSYSIGATMNNPNPNFNNNIIVNERSNAGVGRSTAIAFYDIQSSVFNRSNTGINNNIYYTQGVGTYFATSNGNGATYTFGDWQEHYKQDDKSGFYDPNFLLPNGASWNGNLHLNSPTPAEGMAEPQEETEYDFDGQLRNTLSPDAGMDEGNFTSVDVVGPEITYTKLSAQCGTGDRTFTANIKDKTGIYTTGAKRPRVYYKKNAGAYFDRVGTLQSGDLNNGTWSFTIQAADMGGLANNDVVYYFIVAQDTSTQLNLFSKPAGADGSETNVLTDFPNSPNSYFISTASPMSGSYDIGTGQTFTTLKNAFTAYNNGCIADDVTFFLKDSIYNITSDTLKYNATASENGKLSIRPTKTNTVITGNSSTASLIFQSTQFITLDGSFNGIIYDECSETQGNRNLTIKNINNGTNAAVVLFTDEVLLKSINYCALKNTFVFGNNNQTKTGVLMKETNSTNKSSDITVHNNGIGACQIGIDVNSTSTSNYIENINITKNDLNYSTPNNVKQYGIVTNYVSNCNITGNKIDHIRRNDTKDVAAILAGYPSTATLTATSFGSTNGFVNSSIKNNIIDSVIQTNTASAIGILISTSDNSYSNIVANNMISHVMANSISNDISAGILCSQTNSLPHYKIVNNTIHMQGVLEGSTPANAYSTCFGYNVANSPNIELKNNIFINTQRGNAGATMRFTSLGTYESIINSNFTSDNNDLFANGAGPGTYAIATTNGFTSGFIKTTLLDWQNFSGRDSFSHNFIPEFKDHNDLHLMAGNVNSLLDNSGIVFEEVGADADCELRSESIPDIGADEFISCIYNNATDIAGVQGQTITTIQDVSKNVVFYYNCEPMVTVIPFGPNPISKNVSTKLTLSDTSLFYGTRPLGRRYFDIEPSIAPNVSTGKVILYFKQADFDIYNQTNGNYLELPKDKNDTLGMKNLRILQMHGTTVNNDPNGYSGATVELDPAKTSLVWSNKLQAWIVTLNVYGFSGFYLSSAAPICRTSNIQLTSNIIGFTYKWQVNTGSGYTDLTNGGVYSGVSNDTLTIASPPTSYRGYKYKCVVNNVLNGQENELLFSLIWKGTSNVNWGTTANWGCSSLPDEFTDVLIDTGTPFSPQVNIANAKARTLKVTSGANLQINASRQLRVSKN